MLKCEKCGKEYKNKYAYNGHRATCGGSSQTVCEICGEKIANCAITKHVEAHRHDFNCTFCGKFVFNTKNHKNKFCSQSCSAKYSNTRRSRNSSFAVDDSSDKYGYSEGSCTEFKYCKNCITIIGKNKKYCSTQCLADYDWKCKWKRVQETGTFNGILSGRQSIRTRLLQIWEHKCQICGLDSWNGQEAKTVLVLDHINGDSTDNSLKNLRFICCNCDAQTDTYKYKNKGNGRAYRRERYAQGKSY